MATVTVKQTAGDYSTLASALSSRAADGDIISIEGTWSVDDTAVCSVSFAITITTDADSRYSPGSTTAYRLRTTTGHSITTVSDVTMTGVDVRNASTGDSDEVIRINFANVNLIIKDSFLHFASRNYQQDICYSNSKSDYNVLFENCGFALAERAVFDDYRSSGVNVVKLNSCTTYDIGSDTSSNSRSGVFGIYQNSATTSSSCSAFNCLFHVNATSRVGNIAPLGSAASLIIDRCLTNSSGDVMSVGTWDTETLTNIVYGVTFTDGALSAGDYVGFTDVTTAPYDLSIFDDANNDAQDNHTSTTGAGFTIPSTDVDGTARPQNTNYDLGFFEIVAAGGDVSVTLNDSFGVSDSLTRTVLVGQINYDRVLSSSLSINDPQTRLADAIRALLSGIDINDLITRAKLTEYLRTLSSNIDITDGDLQHYIFYNYTTLNNIDINDSIIRAAAKIYEVSLLENIELTDTLDINRLAFRLLTSNIDLDDFISREVSSGAAIFIRTLTSSVDAADLIIDYLLVERALASTLDLTDTIAINVLAQRLLSSGITIDDFISRLVSAGAVNIERILQSNIDIFDLITSTILSENLLTRVLQSSLDLFDIESRDTNLTRGIISSLGVSDLLNPEVNLSRLLTSQLVIDDSILSTIQGKIIERAMSSALNTNDILTTTRIINRALAGSIALADELSRQLHMERLQYDSIDTIIDVLVKSGTFTLTRILTDELGISDVLAREFSGQILKKIIFNLTELDISTNVQSKNIAMSAEVLLIKFGVTII